MKSGLRMIYNGAPRGKELLSELLCDGDDKTEKMMMAMNDDNIDCGDVL